MMAILSLGSLASQASTIHAVAAEHNHPAIIEAGRLADEVYSANLQGQYQQALIYADSAISYLNKYYKSYYPHGIDTMVAISDHARSQAEIVWLHDSLKTDYDIILSVRNESAVAALALHEWTLYRYNNKVYTQLFKELSADNTLGDYCKTMQRSKTNKTMAIVILLLLFLMVIIAYVMLYYRHRVYYKFCVDKVNSINNILLSDKTDEEKLEVIQKLTSNEQKGSSLLFKRAQQSLPDDLARVVEQVVGALEQSLKVEKERNDNIEQAEDELKRLQMENDKLHISNSVLDNCLSTLKHETMYYPSRIRILVEGKENNLDSIAELANYYKELYTLLSQQAMRQLDTVKLECKKLPVNKALPIKHSEEQQNGYILADDDMLRYMDEILKKQNGGTQPLYLVRDVNDKYITIEAQLNGFVMNDAHPDIFTPNTDNIPFLLCRQIVRDIGECTNARGCGITTLKNDDGGTSLVITLAKAK